MKMDVWLFWKTKHLTCWFFFSLWTSCLFRGCHSLKKNYSLSFLGCFTPWFWILSSRFGTITSQTRLVCVGIGLWQPRPWKVVAGESGIPWKSRQRVIAAHFQEDCCFWLLSYYLHRKHIVRSWNSRTNYLWYQKWHSKLVPKIRGFIVELMLIV